LSEIAKIFKGLPKRFNKAGVKAARSYYFSLGDDEKWTVRIGKDKCTVEKGKHEDADCFFKAAPELFLDVWNGTHKLGPTDFLTGRVKSNKPMLLKEFVAAFAKKK
jgi:putative sterol carrier protein